MRLLRVAWSRRACWRCAGVGVLLFLVAGCKLGPDYERPEVPTPTAFKAEPSDSAADAGVDATVPTDPAGSLYADSVFTESVANLAWWELYQDPVLQELIRTGLENNQNLDRAMARIAEARAALGIARADLYPTVSVIGSGFIQASARRDTVTSLDNFRAALAVNYQVDLFGRIARSNEAARAVLLATEEAYRTVTIALVADIAESYLVLRDLDARLLTSIRTVELREAALELLKARVAGGLVAEIDVNRSQIELDDARAVVTALERSIQQVENGLSLLLGSVPLDIPRGLALANQPIPPSVPAGLPSELLQRRPDVLAAEQGLAAQTARIGVAEAARWPSLSLTGALGLKSTELRDSRTNNLFVNIGADLAGAILDAGRRRSAVDVEVARAQQALADYELAVLNSFREVENALTAVETYRQEHEIRTRQTRASRETYEVAQLLYDEGLINFNAVIDLQRVLFQNELRTSEVLQLHHTAVVRLYEALGGGWNPDEGQETAGAPGDGNSGGDFQR